MEKYLIDQDIKVICVTAASFPEGIGGAFHKLSSIAGDVTGRKFYGISFLDKTGGIIYKAAIEEAFAGEGEQKGYETFLIKKGEYISEFLPDWKKDETIIGKTFQQLSQQQGIDMNSYCLEIYQNERDVRCLIPLVR